MTCISNLNIRNKPYALLLLLAAALTIPAGCAAVQETTYAPADDADQVTEQETVTLFDGTTLDGWTMAGPGDFVLEEDGIMRSEGGMGLFYYEEQVFRNYVLELDWKASSESANSGVFLRFPEATDDPWHAVHEGYEIQILDDAPPMQQTGSIYDFSAPFKLASNPAGEWNTFRIEVTGQRYQVYLNGEKVNDFFGDRGREGYIGFQNHDPESTVWFRDVQVTPLPDANYPESLAEYVAVTDDRDPVRVLMVTTTHGFRHSPAIEASKELVAELEQTTEFQFEITEDIEDLNEENLAQYDLLFLNNATLRTPQVEELAAADEDVWRGYRITLETPQGDMDGIVMLYGEPGDLSGNIRFSELPGPTDLDEVRLEDDQLTFHYTLDPFGQVEGEATLEYTAWDGSFVLGDQRMPVQGVQIEGDELTEGIETEGISPQQQAAILNFIEGGKGLVGTHSALDALYAWDEYREIVGGGLFESHPWTQSVRVRVEEPGNPAVQHLGDGFWIRDEIYVLDENPRWNSRVLLSLDMRSVGVEQGSPDQTRDDHPLSWIRNQGEGRVFMTALGHFPDVWTTPDFVEHLLQGMRMAAEGQPADFAGRRVKETIAEDVWPHDIAVDERSNVWIAELRGKIHLYDSAENTTRLIAELETTDPTNIEHGLFGIEIDPDFYNGEPYVYLYYTEPETFINTLSRFEYRDGQIDLENEDVLLRVPTEPYCCHQAGDIEWGPDGTLYLSTGDTGMSETRPSWELSDEELDAFMEENSLTDYHWSRLVDSEITSQNLQDLRGKILRINRDGSIPHDNPFFGEPGVRWETYAYGMRNPFQFTIDQENGYLYIAVVGPDAAYDFAEYNVSREGGENFGWPRSIGRLVYNQMMFDDIPNFHPPMWEYTYETGGRSPFNGPIYRHDGEGGFPEIFQDKIFIMDWARNWIKWADVDQLTFEKDTTRSVKQDPQAVEMPALRYVDIKTFDTTTDTRPIAMQLGPDGALYLGEFDGFWDAGPNSRVTRYRWVRGLQPVGAASVETDPSGDGLTFHFDASESNDPDAGALAFDWSFGDGATSTAARPVHTYAEAGTYTVSLTVTDSEGLTSEPVEFDVHAQGTTAASSYDERSAETRE